MRKSGRRTLAVKLKRQGIDERHIGEILGMTSIKAIKTLCDTDPVRLHIPVENEHLFRFKMNADSGLRVHHFRTPQSTNSDVR